MTTLPTGAFMIREEADKLVAERNCQVIEDAGQGRAGQWPAAEAAFPSLRLRATSPPAPCRPRAHWWRSRTLLSATEWFKEIVRRESQ